MKKIETDHPELFNNNEFVVKLPFVAGGYLGDKESVKYGFGVEGILQQIRYFLRWNPFVLGYIPYVIIQPRFAHSTEAKVSISVVYYLLTSPLLTHLFFN